MKHQHKERRLIRQEKCVRESSATNFEPISVLALFESWAEDIIVPHCLVLFFCHAFKQPGKMRFWIKREDEILDRIVTIGNCFNPQQSHALFPTNAR